MNYTIRRNVTQANFVVDAEVDPHTVWVPIILDLRHISNAPVKAKP